MPVLVIKSQVSLQHQGRFKCSSIFSVLFLSSHPLKSVLPCRCVFVAKCIMGSNGLGICSTFLLNVKSIWHSDQLLCETLWIEY